MFEESEDLPKGWKTRGSPTGKEFLLSPDGQQFVGRKTALQHMIHGQFGNGDVDMMRKSMDESGWKESTHLPRNWIYRNTNGTQAGIEILT